ncbi:FixH family protein [Ramlibacter sp. PS3R-8]|uniref:FixH family protein n=1 Tax=Ramlibacter sp. PS3R-8 TaxID=3133437 RepID=UPI00309BD716
MLSIALAHRPRSRSVPSRLSLAAMAAFAGALIAGCSTPPANLDVALEKPSAAGFYRVALVPPAQPPAINQMHSWKVKLAGSDGAPVQGARFTIDGGMPQHGHGLPTQPRVTRELGDGAYQLDGMKFSMTGWWEIRLAIQGPQGEDKVTFNTVVQDPKVRP